MKTHIHLIVEDELKARLEEMAEKDGRSVNNLINRILTDYANEDYVIVHVPKDRMQAAENMMLFSKIERQAKQFYARNKNEMDDAMKETN